MCRYRPFVFRIFPHDLQTAFIDVVQRENISVDDPFQKGFSLGFQHRKIYLFSSGSSALPEFFLYASHIYSCEMKSLTYFPFV